MMIPCHTKRIVIIKNRTDFRKGFNGLLADSYKFGFDPYQGDFLVFVKSDRSALRCLVGDARGLYLLSRRFEAGQVSRSWTTSEKGGLADISSAELALILEGVHFTIQKKIKSWKI